MMTWNKLRTRLVSLLMMAGCLLELLTMCLYLIIALERTKSSTL